MVRAGSWPWRQLPVGRIRMRVDKDEPRGLSAAPAPFRGHGFDEQGMRAPSPASASILTATQPIPDSAIIPPFGGRTLARHQLPPTERLAHPST